MSTGPKPSDNLELLKELMLGDEQREIAALREKLSEFEDDSIERLSRDLAAAVQLRNRLGDESFDELVAALQAGTESAIQRSVTEDKSRLSKALFPIMGPAIRSYVVELFRTMVEDLNETVRNTTSIERLKWRFQAKSAGVPFSDYVMMKTAHFKVEELFLIQRESGLLLQHVAANPEDEDEDADLVSGMFTAIRSFVRDSFGDRDVEQPEELKRFTIGERQVLIEDSPSMVLAAVVHGTPSPAVRNNLKTVIEDLQQQFHETADEFSGDMDETAEMRSLLQQALLENRPDSGKGGGMWRAWLVLSVVILGLAGWIGYGIWDRRHWNGFEKALAEKPGVELIDVRKQGWGGRTVIGLVDPFVEESELTALAGEHGIRAEKVDFQMTEVPLLDFEEQRTAEEASRWNERRSAVISEVGGNIAETRKEIESTRQEIEDSARKLATAMDDMMGSAQANLADRLTALETRHRESVVDLLRSQYSHVPEVRFELTDTGLVVGGSAPMPEFQQLSSQLGEIESLGTVDTTGLQNATATRIEELLLEIGETGVLYEDGTLAETDRESISKLGELVGDLIIESGKMDRLYRFDVISHPLIGDLREGNRPIEQKRAEQVRQQLIEAGIPEVFLNAKISEDMTRSGNGVRVVPRLVPAP